MGFIIEEEILTELPREITTHELLGRKVVSDLQKRVKSILVYPTEDWSNYTLVYPKNCKLSFSRFNTIPTISYVHKPETRKLTLKFSESVTPLEARYLTQHLLNEFENDRKKAKRSKNDKSNRS